MLHGFWYANEHSPPYVIVDPPWSKSICTLFFHVNCFANFDGPVSYGFPWVYTINEALTNNIFFLLYFANRAPLANIEWRSSPFLCTILSKTFRGIFFFSPRMENGKKKNHILTFHETNFNTLAFWKDLLPLVLEGL